jgi:hypothetical protein
MRLHEIEPIHNEEMNLWEMANLSQKQTGLPVVIWVSQGMSLQHGPRVKVCNGSKWSHDNATITIHDEIPRMIGDIGLTQDQFAKISEWIILNREALLQYWYGDLLTDELMQVLTPVTP